MSHREFNPLDPDSKVSTDESAPPLVPLAPMSDRGGIPGGSSGIDSWRYKGVHRSRDGKKWTAEMRPPYSITWTFWLGSYSTPVEAAFAYDVAVMCLGCSESMLNFYHPIYKQIRPVLPDPFCESHLHCRKVVRQFLKLATEVGNSVPMTLVHKPKYNRGGVPGTSQECPDQCPECGNIFLASQSMLLHLMDHWNDQQLSPPPQSSRESGGDSRPPGMGSRWWSMYKGIRYHGSEVDMLRAVATHNTEELPSQEDDWDTDNKWAAWIWLPHGNEILLGLYNTTLEAAYAYDVAVMCLSGKPLLNFHGHSTYKKIPQISLDSPLHAITVELKKVVKEFEKVAMSSGYSGMLDQGKTVKDLLGTYPWKSAHDGKDKLHNFFTQQAHDLDSLQKRKRRFSDISCSDDDVNKKKNLDPLFDKMMREFSNVQEPEVEMPRTLSPNSSINAYNILDALPKVRPANTRNKQPFQPIFLGRDMLSGSLDGAVKFTMVDLKIITENFSKSLIVGQGGSRSIYLGQLKDGTIVAVKRIKKIDNAKNFQTKVDTLSKEKHLNLVRVLGFLEDENELILVTEYVTNGNLRQHLDDGPSWDILDMSKRCTISLDVVTALKHLHYEIKDDLDIIHRDIKSSSILITNDFRAKVAGFSLAQRNPFEDVGASSSSTPRKEIVGCMAHEHSTTHRLKELIDVYLFGELLVEIFTGKHPIESKLPSDKCVIQRWVLERCVEGRLMDYIDPKIIPTTFNLKILEQIFKLAASCLAVEEANRPNVKDVFWDLSFIVGQYFMSLEDESNSKKIKYEVQEERKSWDLEACIEPNLQTLCLEESKALKGHEPTKHLYSSNLSFMPTKPHGSLFVEGFESSKVQASIELGTQLEVDSRQASRQASKLLVAKQEQFSPMFKDIISDMFQLKSDETYFEMLQEEIAKLGYISRLLSQGDDFEQKLSNIGKISFFLYFNGTDNVFEFYFKSYQDMASIVGVGLEFAKVVLEDGWRVTIQEISKPKWDDAWKNFDSLSSTMKVTILDPLEEDMDNMEDSQASIPRGQCLLLDLAQYFILKMAIASFLPRASMTHANIDSSTSSSPSSQDIARSSSNSDQKSSTFFQAMKNIFISREANQIKTRNVDDTFLDSPSDDDAKIDTTVHLKLLPGGCFYDGSNLLDAISLGDKELEELTSQLDNTICLEMLFKFLNEDDKKEIHVIVGPISFQFREENENNYERTGRFGWYHKLLEVSFGPTNAHCSVIGPNHKALDIVDWKMTKTIGSSNATTRESSKSVNGGVKGSVPHILTLSSDVNLGWSNSTCESINVGDGLEKPSQMTIGGFDIFPKRYQLSSTLKYAYRAPDHKFEVDLGKLPYEDYRKLYLNLLPMCSPQDVKFEGTWYPKDIEYNPQVMAEYSLVTSRLVHMTRKEISEKVVKKSWTKRCGHLKTPKYSNEPLRFTQKYTRRFFLNHAMTHLNGEKFKVEEILHQRPLNEREPETHLEDCSCYAPKWQENPLVGLNSELDYQP